MNKTIMTANLVNDPNLAFIPGSGNAAASFRVASKRDYKNKNGEYDSDFYNVKCFGKTAETIAQYCTKGSKILIEGVFRNNNYEKDGKTVYTNELIINRFEFLGSKKEGGQQQNNNSFGGPIDDFSGMSEDMEDGIPF